MDVKNLSLRILGASLFCVFSNTHAVLIGGIEFPDGAVSFADSVFSYSPGADVGAVWDNPTAALGIPDYPPAGNAVSLGDGGELILQFTDNSLTTSSDGTPDLHIFEIGGTTEWMNVAISTNAIDWLDIGDVLGQPTSIDIDAVAGVVEDELYSYVRISDIPPNQTRFPFGEADIDAVGAISSGAPVAVPEPSNLALIGLGLLGLAFGRVTGKHTLRNQR